MLSDSNNIKYILSKSGVKTKFNVESFMAYIESGSKLLDEDTIPFIAYSACCVVKMYQNNDSDSIIKAIEYSVNYNFFEEFWKIAVVIGHDFQEVYPKVKNHLVNNLNIDESDIDAEII